MWYDLIDFCFLFARWIFSTSFPSHLFTIRRRWFFKKIALWTRLGYFLTSLLQLISLLTSYDSRHPEKNTYFFLSSIVGDSSSWTEPSSSSSPWSTEISCVSSHHTLFWFKMVLIQCSRVFWRQSILCSLIIGLNTDISASKLGDIY